MSFIKCKVGKRAGLVLVIASVMPPPFPFTPFVAGAAAFGYPRKRLLAIIGVARFVRFGTESILATRYAQQIRDFIRTSTFEHVMLGLIALAVVLSLVSIYHWATMRKRAG